VIETVVLGGCAVAAILVALYVWGRLMAERFEREEQLAAWRAKPLAPVVRFPVERRQSGGGRAA